MSFLKPAVPFFLALVCLLQSRLVYSQQTRHITLTERDVPLRKALEDIRAQVRIAFFGTADWEHTGHKVSFSLRDATLSQVLDSCFRDQPFTYKLVDGGVAILPPDRTEKIVRGRVVNMKQEPLAGITVLVRGDPAAATSTGEDGSFTVRTHMAGLNMVFTSVNYESMEVIVKPGDRVLIQLQEKIGELSEVVVHTGYQEVHQLATTGSFDKLDNELVNRRVSPNILSRMDGVSSSVLFNTNLTTGLNQSTVTIRGRSTIFSNPNPLIVVDNFPYTGDINNINPDDVESITVLKDAAAASIWGALSGNGVIVITTKKGKLNQKPTLSFNTSQTVGAKPDLYYLPILSANDYINVEEYLFRQGYYNNSYFGGSHIALTPVVNLLFQDSLGEINATQGQTQIDALRSRDYRPGLSKYFYRPAMNSQVSLSLSGGSDHQQYFLSAGYDRDLNNPDRNEYDRVTLNGNTSYFFLHNKLELNTGLAFTASTAVNDNPGGTGVIYPYAQVADGHGNPLPVARGLNANYIDTAGGGKLLDWHYRPLQELREADNPTRLSDYRINIAARYRLVRGLDIQAFYQYGHGNTDNPDYQNLQTYYTRNLINEFTHSVNGVLSYPVPVGGILTENMGSYTASSGRLQVSYNDSLFSNGALNLIAGAEERDIEGENNTLGLYGYNPDEQTGAAVDYVSFFPQYTNAPPMQIPYNDHKIGTSERYISYFGNAVYTYQGRYVLSGSLRRDESNLFGVNANQKGVPLGSLGAAWDISREKFYRLSWLPFFRLRVSDGYNGNVDRSVSAYTTANISTIVNNFGAINATIINPPNTDLRWERIHIVNFGADLSTRGDRFGATVEYYLKTGLDLIGESPVDPTTGVTAFTGNTANIRDHGVDLTLKVNNSFGHFRWNSALLFSFVQDKVTKYEQQLSTVGGYLSLGTLNPLVGRPLYSVYALRWRGLDPQTGDPRGFLQMKNGSGQETGQVSENYNAILNAADLSNLVYKGSVNPPFFGSWRNSVFWKQWGVSFNVLYKLGYVFRRSSIDYSSLYNGTSAGHPDFDRRWQQPGDELHTNVPSMPVPNLQSNEPRDNFYQGSEVLVEKGDQVRLQDIQLTYDLNRNQHPNLPAQLIRFYLYANNLGIIWKANHAGVDPDFISTLPNPRTVALGVKADF